MGIAWRKKMTQAEIIKKYLKDADVWIPAYNLRSVSTKYGWIGHQGDRVCRKLTENGEIERKLVGRYAHYRTKKEEANSIYCSECGTLYKYVKDFSNKVIRYCPKCQRY